MTINLDKIKKIHLVGIKGIGMTSLAIWAKERGWQITGSDIDEEFPTDRLLKKMRINWKVGFNRENVTPGTDLVIATGAHGGKTNVEVRKAMEMGIPTYMQGEVLGLIANEKKTIAVSGTHGKTTTAALISHLLVKEKLNPSFIVGCAGVNSLHLPAHHGKDEYFIVEADEYINCPITDHTPKFLFLNPYITVITNIEFDHPDVYQTPADVEKSFLDFAKRTKKNGLLVLGIDNRSVKRLSSVLERKFLTYGFSSQADYHIDNVRFKKASISFRVSYHNRYLGEFALSIPGRHNALNSLASSIVASFLGLSWQKIKAHLYSFTGTKRRFELIADINGIRLYDDYAHHPSEIKATLLSARQWFGKSRLIAVFQPHTYSRTRALFADFIQAFNHADVAVIADIYPSAREKKDTSLSAKDLVEKMKKFHKRAVYQPNRDSVVDYIGREARAGDVVFTLGAGDIWAWLPFLKDCIKKHFKYGEK